MEEWVLASCWGIESREWVLTSCWGIADGGVGARELLLRPSLMDDTTGASQLQSTN